MSKSDNVVDTKMYVGIEKLNTIFNTARLLKKSVFIWGKPGIGKSQSVYEYANWLKQNVDSDYGEVIDMRLALFDASDVSGLPTTRMVDNHPVTVWVPPKKLSLDVLKNNGKMILFMDEFDQAQPSVQNACYQIIQDRVIGDIKLPDTVQIIAAGNGSEYNINSNELPQALKNRFWHYYVKENLEQWTKWAFKNNIDNNIINFLTTQKPDCFYDNDGLVKEADIYATPRSWTVISEILKQDIKLEEKKTIIFGIIGSTTTFELFNFIEETIKYQDFNEILNGKEFKAKNISEFYGCFLSVLKAITDIKDDEKSKKLNIIVNTLLKLQNREWIAIATKLLMDNPFLSTDALVSLANYINL